MLLIQSKELADQYSAYIDEITNYYTAKGK
jgi:hypothetical protein